MDACPAGLFTQLAQKCGSWTVAVLCFEVTKLCWAGLGMHAIHSCRCMPHASCTYAMDVMRYLSMLVVLPAWPAAPFAVQVIDVGLNCTVRLFGKPLARAPVVSIRPTLAPCTRCTLAWILCRYTACAFKAVCRYAVPLSLFLHGISLFAWHLSHRK